MRIPCPWGSNQSSPLWRESEVPLSQEALGPSGFFSRVSQTLRISLLVYIYIYILGFLFSSPCKESATSNCKASVYVVQKKGNVNIRRLSMENIISKVSCSLLKVEDGLDDEACELVSGLELSIGEGADSINACLFKAMKNNNGCGILLLSDIFGFEDSSTREFAYRVACNGYKYVAYP